MGDCGRALLVGVLIVKGGEGNGGDSDINVVAFPVGMQKRDDGKNYGSLL